MSTTPSDRTPSRLRIALIAIAGVVVIALAIGIPALLGGGSPEPAATTPAPSETPVAAPTPTPDPAAQLDVPGYEPNPGPFSLTPVAEAEGETIDAALALDAGTARSGDVLGFSFEATELASPAWGSADSNIEPMLAALDQPILRFGGVTVDRRTWWTSADEPAPEWARATVTPADLERVAATAEAVDAEVTIALDLGHDDPQRAADMAAHAREAFGERLLAISIGNEPNGYHHPDDPERSIRGEDWTTDAYRESLRTYADAIEEVAPGMPIAGPGAFDAAWWRAFAEAELPTASALTMHWYPLYSCGTANPHANATIENLTSPEMRERAQRFVGRGVEAASELGLPLWVEETGPTSCSGGNETSRTHAQALWTTDFALTLQEAGASRVALHSTLQACRGGAPMSPICASGPHGDPGELFSGRTSFLAMMQLGWLPEGQTLLPTVSGDGEVFVHGVIGDDGSLALMVVDQRDPQTAAGAAPVRISAPTGVPDAPASWTLTDGSRLSAPTLDATQSTLGAPTALEGAFADAELTPEQPLTITSEPGSTTLLRFSAP
ncbi:flagellar basal body-associated FliL family protein [Agrococcus baldri]|uniref:Glycosyl hydrolase family 79, N-terminal domain n=1 Tax=Agrococcus baldri TaxID=153730 RepID=A0AA87RCR0_9MICO|nr:hypothetical protein [Agrococcus baldri]GEK80690.1 hypothetical protein ABA31_20410 [Agrococcus baldri]